MYPFVLLSIITSLALNLSVQRTARQVEGGRHSAQISVLEDILARLRAPANAARLLTAEEQEEIERELELVGLGRGRGKEVVSAEMSDKADKATSWKEVFLGKKGKGYEQEEDKTDWEAGAWPLLAVKMRSSRVHSQLTSRLRHFQSSDKLKRPTGSRTCSELLSSSRRTQRYPVHRRCPSSRLRLR